MKKIRKTSLAAILLLFTVLFLPGIANAKAPKEYQGNLWDFDKTIQKTSGAFTFYAYPSKNQREAWIYKIDIKVGKIAANFRFRPNWIIKKLPVLAAEIRHRDSDEVYNIFDIEMEPWHPYNNGESAKVNRIKKLVLPDTVKIIQPTTFGGMDSIKEVKIPKSVKKLEQYTFYHCDKLKKAELPKSLKSFNIAAFINCPKLTELKLSAKNKMYQVKNNCVITKKKKEMIFALSSKQTLKIPEGVKVLKNYAFRNCIAAAVHIPASVEKIEKNTFSNLLDSDILRIGNVTVDEKNNVYAKDGQCIYNKTDNSLVLIIWDKRGNLYISDKVERLTEDAEAVGPKYLKVLGASKVVYPKNLKTVVGNGFFHMDRAYFTAENPPRLVAKKSGREVEIPVYEYVYVPEGSAEVYKQWYKKHGRIINFAAFKPEEKI